MLNDFTCLMHLDEHNAQSNWEIQVPPLLKVRSPAQDTLVVSRWLIGFN